MKHDPTGEPRASTLTREASIAPTDSPRKRWRGSGGCTFVFFACVAACTLLLFNGALVSSLYDWYVPSESQFQQKIQYKQLATITLPIVMVLMEYWLYDFIVDRLTAIEDLERQQQNQRSE